nr:aldo/keto reductase [Streptomyces resistomycificus]
MKYVSLGGLDVSRIGLGAMTMAGMYTTGGGLDDAESIRTIHRALELGVTHIDTAEIYGPFHSEEIVGKARNAGSSGARGHRRRKPVEMVPLMRKGPWSWSSSATTVIGPAPSRYARSCWRSTGPTWTGTRRS